MKPEMSDTKFGVSVDISTSYLSAARENDELLLIGRVIKEGTSSSSQIWANKYVSVKLSAVYGVKSIDFTPESADNLTGFTYFQASVWPSSKATSY